MFPCVHIDYMLCVSHESCSLPPTVAELRLPLGSSTFYGNGWVTEIQSQEDRWVLEGLSAPICTINLKAVCMQHVHTWMIADSMQKCIYNHICTLHCLCIYTYKTYMLHVCVTMIECRHMFSLYVV